MWVNAATERIVSPGWRPSSGGALISAASAVWWVATTPLGLAEVPEVKARINGSAATGGLAISSSGALAAKSSSATALPAAAPATMT